MGSILEHNQQVEGSHLAASLSTTCIYMSNVHTFLRVIDVQCSRLCSRSPLVQDVDYRDSERVFCVGSVIETLE
jgi:hypothetical protein